MPGLAQSLQGHDLGHLNMVAETWGLELDAASAREAADRLSALIPTLKEEMQELPDSAQEALADLSAAGGRQLWSQFERKYGELRPLGSARRDKEKPHRNPISITEQLWYRALIGRAFFDSPTGLEEFAYIPDELLADLPFRTQARPVYGRPARAEELASLRAASDRVLDDACSLLAALRMDLDLTQASQLAAFSVPAIGLQALLAAAGLVKPDGTPVAEAVRKFLEAERGDALAQLVQSWMASPTFDELRLVPGLQAEGTWVNEPLAARAKVLDLLRGLPAGQWWSLSAFIADVKRYEPDYQRASGDYESWYLRSEESGEYLRGFEHWDAVDGALLAFMLRGPLAWLGLVDLAGRAPDEPALAFRLSAWAQPLLAGETIKLPVESEKVKLDSRGALNVPRLAPRSVRYQLSRFCEWLPAKPDAYRYQLGAGSLTLARQQGLRIPQLVSLLKSHVAGALPPNLLQAFKRWEQQGPQARLEAMLVLRVGSAAALKALRASRAARYLGEPIGPLAVAVRAGAAPQVLQALLELGYFGEIVE